MVLCSTWKAVGSQHPIEPATSPYPLAGRDQTQDRTLGETSITYYRWVLSDGRSNVRKRPLYLLDLLCMALMLARPTKYGKDGFTLEAVYISWAIILWLH